MTNAILHIEMVFNYIGIEIDTAKIKVVKGVVKTDEFIFNNIQNSKTMSPSPKLEKMHLSKT